MFAAWDCSPKETFRPTCCLLQWCVIRHNEAVGAEVVRTPTWSHTVCASVCNFLTPSLPLLRVLWHRSCPLWVVTQYTGSMSKRPSLPTDISWKSTFPGKTTLTPMWVCYSLPKAAIHGTWSSTWFSAVIICHNSYLSNSQRDLSHLTMTSWQMESKKKDQIMGQHILNLPISQILAWAFPDSMPIRSIIKVSEIGVSIISNF